MFAEWFASHGTAVVAMAAFGFTGSLHCAGMCGPLSAAACSQRGKLSPKHLMLFYGLRIFCYSGLGVFFGLLGSIVVHSHDGIRQFHAENLGLLLGGLMAVYAVFELARALGWKGKLSKSIFPQSQLVNAMRRNFSTSSPIAMGILIALLPCGFLYAAFLQAFSIAHPFYSGLGMFVFALATSPALSLGSLIMAALQGIMPRAGPFLSALALALAAFALISRSLPNVQHHHHHHVQ